MDEQGHVEINQGYERLKQLRGLKHLTCPRRQGNRAISEEKDMKCVNTISVKAVCSCFLKHCAVSAEESTSHQSGSLTT